MFLLAQWTRQSESETPRKGGDSERRLKEGREKDIWIKRGGVRVWMSLIDLMMDRLIEFLGN